MNLPHPTPRARASRARRARPALLPLLALLAAARAEAAPPGPLAQAIQARQAKLDAILGRHPGALPAAAREELGVVLASLLDFEEMARQSLGAEWEKRTAQERREFVAAFEELVRANSLRNVDIYRAEAVQVLDESVEGERGRLGTSFRTKDATTEVVYDFRRRDGAWRIVDYSIDGVSAVKSYRSQFGKILEKRGFPTLLERLRKRAASLEPGNER